MEWNLHHASCVLVGARAVLIRGRPGAGKSRLAGRLIEAGGLLVADDQVWLAAASGRLLARAPDAIRGLLEIRGLGPVRLDCEPLALVGLVADLVAPDAAERLPEREAMRVALAGVSLPRLCLAAADGAAAGLVRRALRDPAGAFEGLALRSGGEEDARPARPLRITS